MSSSSEKITTKIDGAGTRSGVIAHLSARIIWGAATFYVSLAATSDSLRLFEQRVFWAFAFMLLIGAARGELAVVWRVLGNRKDMAITLLASALISTNWFVVIWCAMNGQLIVAGIGFFLAPLLMILAGSLLFREDRLTNVLPSLACCCAGIAVHFWGNLAFPWPVFVIAGSTTAYTMLRKRYPLPTFAANLLESGLALLGTAAVVVLLRGPADLLPPSEDSWLYYAGLGVLTSVPMLFYVYSLPQVTMLLVGYLQYVTPTIIMAAGVAAGEPIGLSQAGGLFLIWCAVGLYLLQPGKRQPGVRLQAER
jgi:chloramphenicol-sensitive protein RarD